MLEKITYIAAAIVLAIVILILLVIFSAVDLDVEAADKVDTKCYATCHQFESALLVGCYLSDFEGRKLVDLEARKKAFDRHETYCRDLAKEQMGKDSGCKEE
jgi:hypothetical protein